MAKQYLSLVESYLSRYERGGFLVGDVFKFKNGFKSSETYKKLGQNTQELIDQMIESGLHVRVVGLKDTTAARYPGNPQTATADVVVTLALDNGGGRYTHYVSVSPELGDAQSFYPNLPPIPAGAIRDKDVNIKPKELEKQDHISNKTDKGDGQLSDTSRYLSDTNTQLPAKAVTPSPAALMQPKDYLQDLARR